MFDKEEKDGGVIPTYYACKILGESTFRNPDLSKFQLFPVEINITVNDLYNYIKNNIGELINKEGEKDAIQLLKLS